jgi:UDP-galactopyranose mutase
MNIETEILIIGCGLSGIVLAEQYANRLNKKVCIIEKRSHIGGNIYDYIDEETDIRVHKYGAHLFHTNDELVWQYIQKYSEWIRWDHQVLAYIHNQYIPLPININTLNQLYNIHLESKEDMENYIHHHKIDISQPNNSKDIILSQMGYSLYHLLFEGYTYKQWNKDPSELDKSITSRIPLRFNFDNRYFTDKYQVLPRNGYTKWCENMLNHPNITVVLNMDYHSIKDKVQCNYIYYTGRIDHYYINQDEPLEYRSLYFEKEIIKNVSYVQPNSVINYPEKKIPIIRSVEYKHFLHQKSPHSIIIKEYSSSHGEPYYPVISSQNLLLYEKYKKKADREDNVFFVGRLANFKYFNMDQAIKNALNIFNDHFQKFFSNIVK